MRKIIFADVDGVLNSYRTVVAFGNYPTRNDTTDNFDLVAVGLLREACKQCNAEIVLSSTWRMDKNWERLGETLNLSIVDRTPQLLTGSRGEEIAMWLRDNLVFEYLIIDDNNDMLKSQQKNFIHVDPKNGFSYENFKQTLEILGVET